MSFETNAASAVASGGEVGSSGQLNVPTELENGFLGAHTPDGIYSSLKGMAMAPWEFDAIDGDSAHGGALRGYAPSDGPVPNDSIQVNTPMTMGGGTYAR